MKDDYAVAIRRIMSDPSNDNVAGLHICTPEAYHTSNAFPLHATVCYNGWLEAGGPELKEGEAFKFRIVSAEEVTIKSWFKALMKQWGLGNG